MKMKSIIVCASLVLLMHSSNACALFGLDSVQSAAGEKVISALTIDLSGLKYYSAPKEALAPLDLLAKEATNLDKNISCSELEPFVDFVISNAYTGLVWELPCSNGVFGAMAVGVLTNTFEETKVAWMSSILGLSFHAERILLLLSHFSHVRLCATP